MTDGGQRFTCTRSILQLADLDDNIARSLESGARAAVRPSSTGCRTQRTVRSSSCASAVYNLQTPESGL